MTGALMTPSVNGVWSPAAGSSQTTLQAAMNGGGYERGDGDSADLCGTDGFTNPNGVYVNDLRTTGSAAGGAQREGVWRGVRWGDGRHQCAAGGAELCECARSGADDSARNMQDADAELAWASRLADWASRFQR